jgi:hypothetical protein
MAGVARLDALASKARRPADPVLIQNRSTLERIAVARDGADVPRLRATCQNTQYLWCGKRSLFCLSTTGPVFLGLEPVTGSRSNQFRKSGISRAEIILKRIR